MIALNDKITAIIPNYNDATLLPHAIQSLINQTASLHEIIVVDDGSTDNSVFLVEQLKQTYPFIRLIQFEKNRGVCAALNQGIEHATGDYIILCAADDTYESHMVSLAKHAIHQNPRVGLICGDAVVNRFDMKNPFYRKLPYQQKNTWITPLEFRQAAKLGYVGFNAGGGMLMRRQAVLEAHMLYPELRWHCDWLLYFAIALRHGIYYIDKVFIHINMRANSYAEGKRNWEIQKQVIMDTVAIIKQNYPDLWQDFKQSALLPHYSIRYIPLFFSNAQLRSFITMRLLWKFIINNRFIVRIGRLFPYHVILHARKLLRA